MATFIIKGIDIKHNGVRYPEGSTIELDMDVSLGVEKVPKGLEVFLVASDTKQASENTEVKPIVKSKSEEKK